MDLRRIRFFGRHFQSHFPGGREFNRVADQVDQNLAQAPFVSNHEVWNRGLDFQPQREVFLLGTQGEAFHRFFQALAETERGRVDRDLTRFDLGKVQNVVDDSEQ